MAAAINPALKIIPRPVESLIPYARNARTHSDAQVAQIAASIKEFGWTNPVLIDGEGGIIAGHGRLLAARQLGMAEVPCIVLDHLTKAQRQALVIADNKLALNAAWDLDLLRVELADLQSQNVDLALLGFNDLELADLLTERGGGLTDPDEAPAVPVNPVAIAGDLWLLGRHRLRCGDSTSADDVAALLGPVAPHLMVTDPPYGVNYDPTWRSRVLKDGAKRAEGKVTNDNRADWREAWALFPGEVAYVWHAGTRAGQVAESLTACGFEVRAQIVWAKSRFALSRGHYHPQHEPCWYAVKGTGHWSGDRSQSTLWQISGDKMDTGHGTQKPVECMRRPIENNSSPGQAVYDPFLGSGTTIIAAEMTGRSCLGLEIDPAYCDVIVKRWQDFTGKQATLEGDGRTWAEVADERYDPAKNSREGYEAALGAAREGLQHGAASV